MGQKNKEFIVGARKIPEKAAPKHTCTADRGKNALENEGDKEKLNQD